MLVTLVPLDGYDYKNKFAVQQGFHTGDQFVIVGGGTATKADLITLGVRNVRVIYNKMRNSIEFSCVPVAEAA